MHKFFLLFVSALAPVFFIAQSLPQDVNVRTTTEVGGVTLPGTQSIYVAAMEGSIPEQTAVYRSTAGGPWQELFRLGIEGGYERAPDPIMAYDGMGTLYLEMMRMPPSSFQSHVALYSSTDQGTTWQLKSYPYADSAFGDYPAITALPGGFVGTSYSEYILAPADSWVEFVRSTDGGTTWSAPVRFDGDRNFVGSNFITVGSDLCWVGDRLWLTYGDYNHPWVYYSSSPDSGLTWSTVDTILNPVTDQFLITKLIPYAASDTLFILSHRPHDPQASIYMGSSYDGGQSWTSQTVATSAAYAEALQSGPGILDLVYNETDWQMDFSIKYTWSDDAGVTFSSPVTLWTARQDHQGAGEYQAFMPAADGSGFDLVFVDDSDSSELKYLHFTHALAPVAVEDARDGFAVFPNPTHDVLKFRVAEFQTVPAQYRICDLQGRILMKGDVLAEVTELNLGGFAAGSYLLLLERGNRVDVQRVVKE